MDPQLEDYFRDDYELQYADAVQPSASTAPASDFDFQSVSEDYYNEPDFCSEDVFGVMGLTLEDSVLESFFPHQPQPQRSWPVLANSDRQISTVPPANPATQTEKPLVDTPFKLDLRLRTFGSEKMHKLEMKPNFLAPASSFFTDLAAEITAHSGNSTGHHFRANELGILLIEVTSTKLKTGVHLVPPHKPSEKSGVLDFFTQEFRILNNEDWLGQQVVWRNSEINKLNSIVAYVYPVKQKILSTGLEVQAVTILKDIDNRNTRSEKRVLTTREAKGHKKNKSSKHKNGHSDDETEDPSSQPRPRLQQQSC